MKENYCEYIDVVIYYEYIDTYKWLLIPYR